MARAPRTARTTTQKTDADAAGDHASSPSRGASSDGATSTATNAPRRLILLFDGTWNDVEFGDRDTNIVRLREMIDRALRVSPPEPEARTYVYYRRGVGTDDLPDRILGGVLGFGVDRNVRRGYRFLARYYRPGDDIFVFGFSRGAFTARSLVGYLGAAGLLTEENCTATHERAAWDYYRDAPDDRLTGEWLRLGAYMHPRDTLRVRALCVFDTVGALGVPANPFRWLNRQRYGFHNVERPSITDLNLHAIAIDEQRQPFVATVWRQNKFKPFRAGAQTEQVWFPGVHADVGGGYFDGERRSPSLRALDDIPLDWMLRRLKAKFGTFPAPTGLHPPPDSRWSLCEQHDSFAFPYTLGCRGWRSIANDTFAVPKRQVMVGRDRLEAVVGEMVHISAIERLGQVVQQGSTRQAYAPPSLVALLDRLVDACTGPVAEDAPRIVGWDGTPAIAGSAGADQARAAIAAARGRLAARA